MKGILLAVSAVFSLAAQAQVAEVAKCVSVDRTQAIAYSNDGTIKHTILNGVAPGQPQTIKQGAEHSPVTHEQLGLAPDANEDLFQYPLPSGRIVVIAWSVDPRMPDFMTPDFQPKVLRMSVYSHLGRGARELARYTGCINK